MELKKKIIFRVYLASGLLLWAIMMFANDAFSVWQDYWHSALTMVFGSFIAGSTPLGGGAVAFPVFSKLFAIDTQQAKTFSLFIQSIGMTSAMIFFMLAKVRINWRLIGLLMPSTLVGFTLGMSTPLLLDSGVKVVFSCFALLCGIFMLLLHLKGEQKEKRISPKVMALLGLVCGLIAATLGTGADALLFFFLAIVYRKQTIKIIPTTVTYMALISVFGSLFILISSPQLVTPFVLNSWLVAAPVVFVFAPLGGLVMTKVNPKAMLVFIKTVLIVEGTTTLMFTQLPFYQEAILFSLLAVSICYFVFNVKHVVKAPQGQSLR